MLDAYLTGCIGQLEERIRTLRLRIPRQLPRDYDSLAQTCRNRFDELLATLRTLRDDRAFQLQVNQPERIRCFRRAVADLDHLETAAIAALARATGDDHKLNVLLERIAREINYPLVTPVVTTLSQQYFYIHTDLNLVAVPLVEGQFLLHLPDLYHELGHPLLIVGDEPHVAPFQVAFLAALNDVLSYFHDELAKEGRRRGPAASRYDLQVWQLAWGRFWLTEFFCDLFATFTLGPAFAWSHLHLATMRGGDPFRLPVVGTLSHPADDARMTVMLAALAHSGFGVAAAAIKQRWEEFLNQSYSKAEPEYRRCFSTQLLERLADRASVGVQGMQCSIATQATNEGDVRTLLNEAWRQFWIDPAQYADWEQAAIERLFSTNPVSLRGTSSLALNVSAEE